MTRKEELQTALNFFIKKRSNVFSRTKAGYYDIAIVCIEKELRYYRGCSDVKEFYNEDGELDAPGFKLVSKGTT